MKSIIGKNKLIPVVNFKSIEEVEPLVDIYLQCSIDVIEVTLRSEVSFAAISKIKSEFPQMKLGAGTVISEEQVDELVKIGVDFVVSPGYSKSLSDYIRSKSVAYIPGVQTASELMNAVNDGYKTVKFFPAEASGGIPMIKALSAPFKDVKFCPTGGITADNMKDYLALSCVDYVGASFVANRKLIEEKSWDKIKKICEDI